MVPAWPACSVPAPFTAHCYANNGRHPVSRSLNVSRADNQIGDQRRTVPHRACARKVLNFGPLSVSANSTSRIIRFSSFEVNLHTGELRQRGQKVKLQEQPLQVLAALLERPG